MSTERALPAAERAADELGYAVVIPAYNESATIADVARRALRQGLPVVVVDDGSTDGTGAALAGLPVRVLKNRHNVGKGSSLWRGMRYALELGVTGVITLDGDGQHAPEDISRLVRVAHAHPQEIIIGARLGRRQRAPRARYLANRLADFCIGWAAGQPFDDSQSGFRVYPASLLARIAVRHGPTRGFVFESEMLIAAARLGIHVRSVPVESIYPLVARPSHFRPVRDTARIGRMVAWQLVRRGLHPAGLYRSLSRRPERDTRAVNETT